MTASWGSPYPESDEANFRAQSPGSEPSEDSPPIHRLELDTPFLRPAPYLAVTPAEQQPSSLATILVNRARRPGPARGLTEDWIRQHTAADESVEPRHWFSDGSDSEHSSLSGSQPGDEIAWLDRTPKANVDRAASRQSSRQHPRARSSTETLKQSTVDRLTSLNGANMATTATEGFIADTTDTMAFTGAPDYRPTTPNGVDGSKFGPGGAEQTYAKNPTTPSRAAARKEAGPTPRIKKRVPWRGKNIMVLLPREDEAGRFGTRHTPLKQYEVSNMFREWEELGYNIRGFDLDEPTAYSALPVEHYSRSRDEWPDAGDVSREWAERKFKVTLPDIDGQFLTTIPLRIVVVY